MEKEAKRRQELAIAQQIIARQEAIRKQEETYESILQKMVGDPSKVTDADLKQLGNDVGKLKQEAENRISELPREQRELKLALIRGDTISKSDIRKALEVIFAREGEHFSFAIKQLTALQVQILTAIARRGGKEIYSGDFLNFSGVKSTASVRRAMSRLVDEGLVYSIDGEWTIDNPFFAEWIRRR